MIVDGLALLGPAVGWHAKDSPQLVCAALLLVRTVWLRAVLCWVCAVLLLPPTVISLCAEPGPEITIVIVIDVAGIGPQACEVCGGRRAPRVVK